MTSLTQGCHLFAIQALQKNKRLVSAQYAYTLTTFLPGGRLASCPVRIAVDAMLSNRDLEGFPGWKRSRAAFIGTSGSAFRWCGLCTACSNGALTCGGSPKILWYGAGSGPRCAMKVGRRCGVGSPLKFRCKGGRIVSFLSEDKIIAGRSILDACLPAGRNSQLRRSFEHDKRRN